MMNMLHRADTPLLKALRPAIDMLARAHRYRDPQTCLHQERVAGIAVSMGAIMGLAPSRLDVLHLAAAIHDIGNLGVPAELVGKAGKLSDAESTLVRMHAEIGHDILLQLRAPFPIAEIVYQHHERLDGSGYPRGLRGDAILLEARILAVADTFDAMTSYRPYRAALAEDFVLAELVKMADVLLDRAAVDACVKHFLSGSAVQPVPASNMSTTANADS
jgi:HD-GYP domain-containing protein (c-di-GMP phosphodiesterase class II)